MTAQTNPYVRVYYSIVDDDRFENVYGDDHALATWLRLLIVADAMYPSPAALPAGCRPSAMKKLIDAGIVEMLGRGFYRIHGLASERGRRSERGALAARQRWDRTADAMQTHSRSNAYRMHSEPLLAEPIRAEAAPNLTEPLHAEPSKARQNGSKDPTKKKPPLDEERIQNLQAEYTNPDTPSWKRPTIRVLLEQMGVEVPA